MKIEVVTGGFVAFLALAVPQIGMASCSADDPDGSKVAAARATADQQCHDLGDGCDNAKNHGSYVSCVAHTAKDLSTGTSPSLPRTCKGAVKKCAANSTCGKAGAVTCYRTDAKGRTKCSIKSSGSLCTAPAGGSVCVGTNASCCDACT
ncbi:MAG: hypothetical protein ACREQL_10310, partial [Candidatus Binatia bacterium]